MDYQTFATREAAQKEIDKMLGWDAEPAQLCLPSDPNADADGNAWVIMCDSDKYLRADGYVR